MYLEVLENIKNQILNCQSYFDSGYTDVELLQLSEPAGIFLRVDNQNLIPISFNSNDSNIFYIRRLAPIKFISKNTFQIPCRLVVVTYGMSTDKLITCLLNCLNTRCSELSIDNIDSSFERILKNEGLTREQIINLISIFKDENLVTIDFTIVSDFIANSNCDCNPCKNCTDNNG